MADAVAGRVVLYVRSGCHLCDEARISVATVTAGITPPPGVLEVDVDSDPGLVARYGELVPVVTVDGRQVEVLRVQSARLRAALEKAPPTPI